MDVQQLDKNTHVLTASQLDTNQSGQAFGTQCSHVPTSSSLNFFPGPGQRGLPPEIRQMVYNEVTIPQAKFKRILWRGLHKICYEDISSTLALLRNGNVWENDACSALEVRRATKAFTLLAYWPLSSDRYYPRFDHHHWLLRLLKAIDAVYAIDLEHQRALTAPRRWAAPLHSVTLRGRASWLHSYYDCTENFLQTTILQLRRKPEINIRIFVRSESLPEHMEHDVEQIKKYMKEFLTQIADGMTVTRLPRPITDRIHHQVTLVSPEAQFAFWKDRVRCVEHDVKWEIATQDDWDLEEDD